LASQKSIQGAQKSSNYRTQDPKDILFQSNNTNIFDYEGNNTGESTHILSPNINLHNYSKNNFPEVSSLMSTTTPEQPNNKQIHNCDSLVKSIGEKISNLKIKLIEEDIKFRINIHKFVFNQNILKILQFMGGDIYGLYKSNKMINQIIKSYLNFQSHKIIEKFESRYLKFFEISEKFLIIKKYKNKSN
jgi:hypothetical protein